MKVVLINCRCQLYCSFHILEEEPVTGEQRKTVTFEMVNTVCKVFKNPKSSKAELRQSTRFAVKAFSACMLRISPDVPPSNFVINEDKGRPCANCN